MKEVNIVNPPLNRATSKGGDVVCEAEQAKVQGIVDAIANAFDVCQGLPGREGADCRHHVTTMRIPELRRELKIAEDELTICVRLSASAPIFGPNEDWTHGPFFGSRGTFFADVTGDGRADAIVVNEDTVTVRRSTGSGFAPNEDWTHGPFFGSRGTFFADVTGDRRADAIVVNEDTVTVRRST